MIVTVTCVCGGLCNNLCVVERLVTAVYVVIGFVTAECVHDCDSNMCLWRVM